MFGIYTDGISHIYLGLMSQYPVMISESGSVFTFGEGSNGQLGHGTVQQNLEEPQEVALMKDTKLKYAACGENHSAIISGTTMWWLIMHKGIRVSGRGEMEMRWQVKKLTLIRMHFFLDNVKMHCRFMVIRLFQIKASCTHLVMVAMVNWHWEKRTSLISSSHLLSWDLRSF